MNLGVMAMMEYSTFSKDPELERKAQMEFRVISRHSLEAKLSAKNHINLLGLLNTKAILVEEL